MGYASFVARRHLMRRKKKGFISLITLISVGGVGIGVMALIVVLSVMSGFDRELKRKIVNVQPHLRIEKIGGVDEPSWDILKIESMEIPGISTLSPFVEGQAILKSENNALGVVVKGVDPEREDLGVFEKHMISGALDFRTDVQVEEKRKLLFFKEQKTFEQGGLIIGRGLARKLDVRVGDIVHCISPAAADEISLLNLDIESFPFVVRGIFGVGMNDFDQSLAVMDITSAQKVYGLGEKVTGLSMRFHDVDAAENWKWSIAQHFSDQYYFRSWYDMNHNFFQALKVEKSVMTILLALIILVAAFNIVSTLTMVVMEKTRDIGILRAIGATRMGIRRLFVIEGFAIGFTGIFLGAVSGVWLANNLNLVSDFIKRTTGLEVFPSDIYYFDKIPSELHQSDVVMTVAYALAACVIAGVYPAHRAAKMNPSEALRYE